MKDRNSLIEKINQLGPWVHAYFKLPSDLVIQDCDLYQRARLFTLRDHLFEIIENQFGSSNFTNKTICDVGCNAGYFLYELHNRFQFLKSTGFDPKKSNVLKAKFIAEQFSLTRDRFEVTQGNIFNRTDKSYDIVIMPGVLHHLDNHILACERLFSMTNDLLILETMALPDCVESDDMASYLELKDDIYKFHERMFGVTGFKLESSFMDGATSTNGIVGVPSKNAVRLMLLNAGFTDVEIYQIPLNESYIDKKLPKYRDFHMVLAVAKKPKGSSTQLFESKILEVHQAEIDTLLPLELIDPLYDFITGQLSPQSLSGESLITYRSFLESDESSKFGLESLRIKPYYSILKSFSFQPFDKIRLEKAKSLIHLSQFSIAESLLLEIVRTVNCDWRTVYRSYHLLSLVMLKTGRFSKARKFNRSALKTHPNFQPALILRDSLNQ